eukprot:3058091-Amphidinium_carterae.1
MHNDRKMLPFVTSANWFLAMPKHTWIHGDEAIARPNDRQHRPFKLKLFLALLMLSSSAQQICASVHSLSISLCSAQGPERSDCDRKRELMCDKDCALLLTQSYNCTLLDGKLNAEDLLSNDTQHLTNVHQEEAHKLT